MTELFSNHAPTGESSAFIVNSNPYSPNGRRIGFPNQFSVYPTKFDANNGSQVVSENRKVLDLIGNRLYLYHRPVIQSDGSVQVNVSQGSLDNSATEPRQGYIVFSTLPTSNFSVSYTAAPDCTSMWYFNNLQNDIMEIQKLLGNNSQTGYPSIRNLALASFDNPVDANLDGVLNRGIYLSHLDSNIYIGSSKDPSLTGSRGNTHTVTIGNGKDSVVFDNTNFTITQSDPTEDTTIRLGAKTGDYVFWSGQLSGEGPVTVGGPSWPGYSGALGGDLNSTYYNNSMLRVNGDVSVLGDVKAVGSITIINLTGEVSTIIGDFTITNSLTVNGTTTLIGNTNVNRLNAAQDLYFASNIIADNARGSGGGGQGLVDNLDCSEVAHSYNTVISNRLRNSVLNGRPKLSKHLDYNRAYRWLGELSGVVENMFVFSGFATANNGPSGVHPNIIQCNFTDDPLPVLSGTSTSVSGTSSGLWSPGIMDPGSLWVKNLNNNFESPIYGYTIESGSLDSILKMNVFCPELDTNNLVQANDPLLIYHKYSIPYDFISAQGGASPVFKVFGSSQYPFEVSFDNEVRKMTSETANISLTQALSSSIDGLTTPATGAAYIFAKANTDPESPPSFSARNIPYSLPKETIIGEVTASSDGSTWTILDVTSYSPESILDTGWIPVSEVNQSGRVLSEVAGVDKVHYFIHNMGFDQQYFRNSVDLYLGTYGNQSPNSWTQAQPLASSFSSRDRRTQMGFSGAFTKISLTNTHTTSSSVTRDASLTYIDGKVVGIAIDPLVINGIPHSYTTPTIDYVRLVMRRDA